MVNIAICDDSIQFLDILQDKLEKCFARRNRECCIKCFDGWDTLQKTDERFDLYLLDVEMPEKNGFDIAGMIRKNQGRRPDFIFVTAHENAVYDIFGYGAIGFVRKSQLEADLEKMIAVALQKWRRNFIYEIESRGENLCFSTQNTVYVEVFSHKLLIHCTDGVYTVWGSLDELEKKLSEADFIRTHRSFLVNPQYIRGISDKSVTVEDPATHTKKDIYMSKRKSGEVMKKYFDYRADL